MANGKVSQSASSEALQGVLALSSDKQTLAIDFSDPVWERGRGGAGATTNIIGRKELTDVVLREAGFSFTGTPPNDIRPGMQWLWSDTDSSIIDRVVFAAKDGPLTTTIADRSTPSPKVSLFAAGGSEDRITGSKDKDFLFGGDGNDT